MKKIFIILAVMFCCAGQELCAQGMRSLFLNAPDELFPLLTRNGRADCVDYIDAGMEATVANVLGGVCRMKVLTDDFVEIEPSGASSMQVRMLPAGGDTLLCVVNTVKAEAADSRISFYTKGWEKVPAKGLFEAPAIKDFFVSADSAALYVDRCDIYLVRLALSKDENTLTAEYTMPDYMAESDSALIKPLLCRIVYRWNGKKFVRE
ncbi:MAG: DUF3256 family protein [Bacteroidaceae bacterium]|nr:DUF3256 family protein [Bacteroidaceae bacterium]